MRMQDCNPQAGDMWQWTEDNDVYILKEPLSFYDMTCYRWSTINLTTGSFDNILFSPNNIDRWRKLA